MNSIKLVCQNMNIRKLSQITIIVTMLAMLTGGIVACSNDDNLALQKERNEQTVIMFFPWSSNLLSHFRQN